MFCTFTNARMLCKCIRRWPGKIYNLFFKVLHAEFRCTWVAIHTAACMDVRPAVFTLHLMVFPLHWVCNLRSCQHSQHSVACHKCAGDLCLQGGLLQHLRLWEWLCPTPWQQPSRPSSRLRVLILSPRCHIAG